MRTDCFTKDLVLFLKNFIYLLFVYYFLLSLNYNVVLITAVQQSDSVIRIYAFIFIFFFIMVYHRILSIIPCAIQ